MRKLLSLFLLFCLSVSVLCGQTRESAPIVDSETSLRPRYDKLSPLLRRLTRQSVAASRATRSADGELQSPPYSICAFVQTVPDANLANVSPSCRIFAQMGDICIADIPCQLLPVLSLDPRILRIEASIRSGGLANRPLTDSLAWYLNALPVYEGQDLPQAYTGRDVIVGIMDIGFDLTHPNFYSRDTTDYRIRRFWDMLAADTQGSTLPVGRDYIGRDEILAVAHARDGLRQTHGTHTLGIAAGSGYNSPYRGMAPESDICIVANAITSDTVFISPDDYYKYTYATDALGFKYIFDYADSRGLPCVINFSEGSQQDFWGNDKLYYEMLRRITGPGRIIVCAAGNNGNETTWFHKPKGQLAAGTFYAHNRPKAMLTMKGDNHFTIRLVTYRNEDRDTLIVNTLNVTSQEDSVFHANLTTATETLQIEIEAYPSCYDSKETCYDVYITGEKYVGYKPSLSVEVIGADADVEVYRIEGYMGTSNYNPALCDGEETHNVLSPSTAPCVISVGATNYRHGIINYNGYWKQAGKGNYGEKYTFSALGPTFDGRTKPDVMAPGMNIISSYSSYYIENNPMSSDITWDVAHFNFNGRTYAWNANSGTSMASPAVAGAIALWLQACPTLTAEKVLDVFSHTCRHYDGTLTYPNNYYGYGEIDVYRGLLYLLGADNIEELSLAQTKAHVVHFGNGHLVISSVGGDLQSTATVRLFSLSGRLVFQTRLSPRAPSYSIALPPLPESVYALQIDGPEEIVGSQLIRYKH